MPLFGRSDNTVTTTFAAKDNMTPVVRGIRATMTRFKQDAATGFGLAAGISVFSAAAKAIDFAGDSLRAYADEQVSVAKLTTAIKENIDAWDGNIQAVEDVIRGRTRLGFSDDQQRESLALLVTQVGDLNDALAIQRTAMDLARVKGIGLSEAGTILARAYNGSTTALQKMGIKLKKGTAGLEAISAVQGRVAGQAQAYSETLAGSAEVMAVSFDEFKESVGGALNDALTPFFNLVVDLTNQAPDLDTTIGQLTQHYRDLIKQQDFANGVAEQGGTIFDDLGKRIYAALSPQDQLIHDFTGTLEWHARVLGVTRKELALFTEAGLAYGDSLVTIKKKLDSLAWGEYVKGLSHWWTKAGDAAQTAGDDIYGGLVEPVKKAMRDMWATASDAKAPWKAAMKALADAAKDPFTDEKFANWMERKARKLVRNARKAYQDGKGDTRAAARALAYVMTNPILRSLAHTQEEIQKLADAALIMNGITANVGGFQRNGSSGHWVPGHWKQTKGGVNWVEGHMTGDKKVIGGMASGTFVAGEYGPEVVSVGSAKAHVSTAQGSGGCNHDIYLDGQRMWRWVDKRQGRAIAMGG